ncbi:MAG: SH3 domain-containing protein, partial [Aggregatilineales bacterium]
LAQTVSVTVGVDISIRSGAGTNFDRLGVLSTGTGVVLEGRDAANTWALGTSSTGLRGWMAVRFLNFPPGANYFTLPVSTEVTSGTPAAAPVAPVAAPADGDVPAAAPGVAGNVNPALVATSRTTLNVRAEDSTRAAVVTRLQRGEGVFLLGRNTAADWLQIQTVTGFTGWVSADYMTPDNGVNFALLPDVISGAAPAVVAAPPASGDAPPPTDSNIPFADVNSSIEDMMARLNATPVLHQFDSQVILAIRDNARAAGNRSNVFTKVGDSITATQRFMTEFGIPGAYNLGSYGNLQSTIDFYSTPVVTGGDNSFLRRGQAMGSAYNAASVIDPIWSDPTVCRRSESPLACEVRIAKPSVALIMLGSVDMQIYSPESYYFYMETIISFLAENGVIPVVTTFPIASEYIYWERSLEFNMQLLDLAERYRIPVINLWAATSSMPLNGTDPADFYHLSEAPDRADFTFDGREFQFALSARNLLSLQALDFLRATYLQ